MSAYVIVFVGLYLFREFLSRFVLHFLWGSHNEENEKSQIDAKSVLNSEKNKTNYSVLLLYIMYLILCEKTNTCI